MKNFFVIGFTFLLALVLEILPLPAWVQWLQPAWVVLAVIFWVVAAPAQVGLVSVFIVGILLDLLMGSLLGEHALLLVLIAYLTMHNQARICLSPFLHQSVMIFIWMVLYQLFLFWINTLRGGGYWSMALLLPALTTAILWPWMCQLLSVYAQRYGCGRANSWLG